MHTVNQTARENDQIIISYLTLRKTVGILGMALPLLLAAGHFLLQSNCTFPPSISHFYYTRMGNYFVGTLCAVSLFMFSYNGYDKGDKTAAKLAGIFAMMVALFPTNFANFTSADCSRISSGNQDWVSYLHYGSATLLFLDFAWFSLFLFTQTENKEKMGRQKKIRNRIYRICGWVILGCIVSIVLVEFVKPVQEVFKNCEPIFILEGLALLAFGFSWLIKGETFFKDK